MRVSAERILGSAFRAARTQQYLACLRRTTIATRATRRRSQSAAPVIRSTIPVPSDEDRATDRVASSGHEPSAGAPQEHECHEDRAHAEDVDRHWASLDSVRATASPRSSFGRGRRRPHRAGRSQSRARCLLAVARCFTLPCRRASVGHQVEAHEPSQQEDPATDQRDHLELRRIRSQPAAERRRHRKTVRPTSQPTSNPAPAHGNVPRQRARRSKSDSTLRISFWRRGSLHSGLVAKIVKR